MEGQGVLTGFEGPGYREVQFLDSIFESLVSSVEAGGGDSGFLRKNSTDFLIIFSNLRKCWKGLLYQAFPAFCVSEDTPHIMAFRSLIWR